MSLNEETKEKLCSFFISDYHFEMISLPYINENIEKNKEIFILTENNLENTINKLISNINLKEEKKKKILNINWNEDNKNKMEKINKNIKDKKDVIIFVKGKEEYIKNTNKKLEQYIENLDKAKIIDCYNVEEISDKMSYVINKYSKVLDTKGEKNIN